MDNDIFKNSLKLAEKFTKDLDNVPKMFDNLLKELIPKISKEEKIKLQNVVKDSNKVIEQARKTGDFVKIKESIDELSSKYGRNDNT